MPKIRHRLHIFSRKLVALGAWFAVLSSSLLAERKASDASTKVTADVALPLPSELELLASNEAPAKSAAFSASVTAVEPVSASATGATGLLAEAKAPKVATPSTVFEEPPPLSSPRAGKGVDSGAATLVDSPSQNVTINLIRKLVKKGLLSQEDADDLIKQAEEEASSARAQAQATQAALNHAQAAAQYIPDPAIMAAADESVRVTYIPETVKAEMREQIKEDVMAQARNENWAAPGKVPDWSTRIRLFGDARVRYEGYYFGDNNANDGSFPSFNAINTGAPFDISGTAFPPQLNVDQNRERIRLRVRLGAEAELGNGFSAGLRIATGESNTPVSTNQSLGLANGSQGGNFSKYAVWLDRGFIRYDLGKDADHRLTLNLGRFENPFFSTEIVYDEDVGFDGAALQGRYKFGRLTPFFSAGAFPVFNTEFNFSSNRPSKFESTDKWLYGGQFGTEWKISKDFNFKVAAAYYHFDGVEGRLSDPFIPLTSADQGNTDDTRPSFAQNGNTYRPIRNIIPSPLNSFGTTNQFQYYGLATPFRELAVTGRLDYNRFEPFQISLIGEYVKNVAFDGSDINKIAVNNRGPDSGTKIGQFEGGDTAWMVNLRAGSATMQKLWDWQVGVNYRYIESDAVVDAFTDSDFGLGGTNQKGYTVYGSLALSPRVAFGVRWMSSNEIAGPPLKVDILQVDLSGKF